MTIDATQELGRLLVYMADVATAIRSNSPYRGDYVSRDPREVGLDVMWLSDSLHCLDRLGSAIQAGEAKEIIDACDSLLHYYGIFVDGVHSHRNKGCPKEVMDRYGHLCDPQAAMAVFSQIRAKAQADDTAKETVYFLREIEEFVRMELRDYLGMGKLCVTT